ncbi:hypothetical protein Tco_0605685 [Tanacetum coccineum]
MARSGTNLKILASAAIFVKIGVLQILHDHTQHLDALPPTLFADIDRDVRELYTRSGAVKDEIFSQRYRLRSLEREHESVAVTFRDLENHDLRMQLAKERCE